MTRPKKVYEWSAVPLNLSPEDAQTLFEYHMELSRCLNRISEFYKNLSERQMAAVVDAHKRPRDPDAPKMPFPAYIMFCNDERPKILEECSNITSQEVTKKLGELWKHLPEETRKKYDDRYQSERQNYEQELVRYKRSKESIDILDEKEAKEQQSSLPSTSKQRGKPSKASTSKRSHASSSTTGD